MPCASKAANLRDMLSRRAPFSCSGSAARTALTTSAKPIARSTRLGMEAVVDFPNL
jgi:hypothetical protein